MGDRQRDDGWHPRADSVCKPPFIFAPLAPPSPPTAPRPAPFRPRPLLTAGKAARASRFLVNHGTIKPLCDMLLTQDLKATQIALDALQNILKAGNVLFNGVEQNLFGTRFFPPCWTPNVPSSAVTKIANPCHGLFSPLLSFSLPSPSSLSRSLARLPSPFLARSLARPRPFLARSLARSLSHSFQPRTSRRPAACRRSSSCRRTRTTRWPPRRTT